MKASDFEILIRNLIDDPDEEHWSNVALGLLITVTADKLWSRILAVSRGMLKTTEVITSTGITSPGFIDLRETGPLTNRFFRLEDVVRNDIAYEEVEEADINWEAAEPEGPERSYIVRGRDLYLFPLSETDSVEITYSYRPPVFNSLAGDEEYLWPDGHELTLCHAVATHGMSKGNREEIATQRELAREGMDLLLAEVSRNSERPIEPTYHETNPEDFGSA